MAWVDALPIFEETAACHCATVSPAVMPFLFNVACETLGIAWAIVSLGSACASWRPLHAAMAAVTADVAAGNRRGFGRFRFLNERMRIADKGLDLTSVRLA